MQLSRLAWAGALAACGGTATPPDATGADAVAPDALVVPDAAPPDAPTICDNEDRDDEYVPGLTQTGPGGYAIVLGAADPAPPAKGNNAWTIEVREPGGSPRAGLELTAYPFMPDHGHGTTVRAVITDEGGGAYTATPINFWMRGYWTVRFAVRDPLVGEDELDAVVFRFCAI